MVTKRDYSRIGVEAGLSVMLELMTLMGEYRDQIVLVGGWVPYFLLGDKGDEHIGSLDIDVALDFENISDDTYKTILCHLEERGYTQGNQPFIFYRTVQIEGGQEIQVEVDLLSGEYGGTGKSHRHQKVQDVRARKTRGCDLAFQQNVAVKLEGKMPDSSINKITIRIAGIVPFLVMKGMALWYRYKEKDAYDIYYTIKHFPDGLDGLIHMFKPFTFNKLVQDGLSKIKSKFQGVGDVGPVWVINFLEIDDEEERGIVLRDVVERVNTFLDTLDVKPFQDIETEHSGNIL